MITADNRVVCRSDLQQTFQLNSNVSYNSAKNVLVPLGTNAGETEPIYEEIQEEIPSVSIQENGSSAKTKRFSFCCLAGMLSVIFAMTAVFTMVVVIVLKLNPMNTDTNTTLITSCNMLPKSSPSGYYWIVSSNHSTIRVYCDMKKSCGNITGGWMRVTSFDMTQNSSKCPSSLCLNTSEPRTCRRCYNDGKIPSETYDVGVTYSHVCGRVIAYGWKNQWL